jgi:hypothetical protein
LVFEALREEGLMNKKKSSAGFTILELAISLLVFVVIVVSSSFLLVNFTSYFTESVFRSNLLESGMVTMERISDELSSAKILSLGTDSSGGQVITFVTPVELDNGTEVYFLDANGEVNWGAVEMEGAKLDVDGDPHRYTISVVFTDKVREDLVDADLNNDGDKKDGFKRGSLLLQTTGGLQYRYGGNRLIIGNVVDVDGDSVADPLFKILGEAYTDSNKNGIYDEGETFIDANNNDVWDGYIAISFLASFVDRDGQNHSFPFVTNLELLYQ